MARTSTRSFNLTLDPDVNAAVEQYQRDAGIDSKQIAVRELILTALASTPLEGQIVAAKNRAFFETRAWVHARIYEFFNQLGIEIKRSGTMV